MNLKERILVVDDESNARTALAELLRGEGYQVESAADGFKALPKLDEFAPDLLLTDLKMPGMDGIELMRKCRARDPECAVLIMTAYGAVESAISAMREGASDYLTKPIHLEELVLVAERALDRRRLRAEAGRLRERLTEHNQVGNIIGTSAAMKPVFEAIAQIAPSRASVLVTGESGTGKELVAAAIHAQSPRRSGPFIKLHCAALAETLLESELFGHERGSFTGAVARREGRLQQADGGTLFLDEIGDIPPGIQVKLLRFLQEHELERVGGNQTIKVDVRVIAATHRDLKKRIQEGKFREDLFYRLNVMTIDVPPLRARRSDIPPIAMHFLGAFAKENGKSITGFTDEALEQLTRYPWPGNVRELENAIERAVILCRNEQIGRSELIPIAVEVGRPDGMPAIPGATMAEIERFVILKTVEHVGGSTSKAADMLGISARTIQYRLQEYTSMPAGAERARRRVDGTDEPTGPCKAETKP